MEKIAVIMRGVPGSGKSMVTVILKKLYNTKPFSSNIAIHSTDNFFMINGHYAWNRKELFKAHEWNKAEFDKSVKAGVPCVICDNTNLTLKEYSPYVAMAKVEGYTLVAIVFEPRAIETHCSRNVHNIPKEHIEYMIKKLNGNMITAGISIAIIIPNKITVEEIEKLITDKFEPFCK